jgi:ESS family glutamate:Na+ symporter
LLIDFGLISLLILGAQVLRTRVRWIQSTYLPTAIIAGLVALACGPTGFDLLPFSRRPDGGLQLVSDPAYLISFVFAAIALGQRPTSTSPRQLAREVGDTFFYNLGCEVGQYGALLLFGWLMVMVLFPELPPGFGLYLPIGFAGGHGTAAAVGTVLQDGGWDHALVLGATTATVGVLAGLVGGMMLIHIAIRKGWTRLIRSAHELPASFRTGLVPPAERVSMGSATLSGVVIETLSWHLALAGAAVGSAALISNALPAGHGIPLYALALLTGWLLRWLIGLVGLRSSLDAAVMGRVGSGAADFLIAFGVASVSITIVLEYLGPLILLVLFGIALSLATFWLGHRMFRTFWFERSIFVWGWIVATMAISVTLLRVVDPDGKSRTLEQYGIAYTVISFVELGILTILPQLVVRGYVVVPALVLLAGFALCLFLSKRLLGWSSAGPSALREGEAAAIAGSGLP